ncbi:MAG: response regulator transcription factor [Nitrospiraceae bacterium]|nr:response regulator transcription factor [Nitrospiraceae bacterium]
MMDRILVIDDDMELCELLKDYLRPEGFDVDSVHNGLQAMERLLSGGHALAVLDVMLPGASGFEVLRHIRERGCRIPVLMLTARGDDVDRIVGLEMGADDYLPKPFNPRELVARIRAIKRRAGHESGAPDASGPLPLSVGDVVLDAGARTVVRAGERLELTAIEFNLLEELLLNAGRLVSREDLSRKVLGHGISPYDRSIDVHISNLRKKLGRGEDGAPRIKTIRGTGYIYPFSPETAKNKT